MTNHVTRLTAGEKAPDFRAADQEGQTWTLAGLQGKKFVLYFYPKDDTPTCTTEACNLRDNYTELQAKGLEIFGINADTTKKHGKFAAKHQLPFRLLSDPELQMIKSYDVWGPKLFMGRTFDGIARTTFIINEHGIIQRVITKVESKRHAEQILENI